MLRALKRTLIILLEEVPERRAPGILVGQVEFHHLLFLDVLEVVLGDLLSCKTHQLVDGWLALAMARTLWSRLFCQISTRLVLGCPLPLLPQHLELLERVRPLRGRLGLLLQIFSISFPVSRALLLPDRHELGLALRVLLDRDLIRAAILLIIFLIIYFALMPDVALLHRCAAILLLFFHLFENAQVDFTSLQEAIDVRAAVQALGFILALSSGQAGGGCTIAAAEVVRDVELALEICAQVRMCFGEQGLRRLGEI